MLNLDLVSLVCTGNIYLISFWPSIQFCSFLFNSQCLWYCIWVSFCMGKISLNWFIYLYKYLILLIPFVETNFIFLFELYWWHFVVAWYCYYSGKDTFFLVDRCKCTHCNQETTWPRIYCSEISEILLLNISDVPISLFKESFLLLFELKIHCKFYVLY